LFSAYNAVMDWVCVLDNDLTIVFMNDRLRSAVGDLIGKKCHETVLQTDPLCTECPARSAWDFSKSPFTTRTRDRDGRIVDFTLSRFIAPGTGETYWIEIKRDVTEKVDLEERLRVLTASFDQMSEAVCVSDSEGRLIYTNKAYVRLTGFDDKHTAGLSISDASGAPASGGTIQTIMRTAASHGWQGEMTGLRKDGARYYTRVDARPVRDEKGVVSAVVAILDDITKQKTEKVEIEKYTSQLESRMEARTTELARKVSQLTTINKISRVVTSILDTDELLDEFAKSIAQGFGYQHVILMLVDRERGDLYLKAAYGRHVDLVPRDMRQKLKEGLIGHAAYFGETLVCGDVESDPRYIRKYLVGTRSELAVPITFRGEILGVLDVQSDIRDAFTRNDVSILEMLADMLATSVTNARIYTESKEREAALSVLDRISKQISYRLEPGVVLEQVARDAATLLKAEKAMVGLVDVATNTLDWVAPYRIDREFVKSRTFDASRGVTGRALKWLKTEVVNDYLADPDAVPSDAEFLQVRSMVSAPLIIEGRGIGVINVYNKVGGAPFTKSDALFLSSLADHAAIALENANLLSSLNQRVHSQLALLETALSMQRQIDSGSIYELVSDKLREVVWYDAITFYKVDHERKMMLPVVARGPYTEEILSDSFPLDVGITGYVAKTGKPELVDDTSTDPRAEEVVGTPQEEEAMMAIPLLGKDRVVGVLAVYRDHGATFSDQEFEIAQVFASQAAVAVENAGLYHTREALLEDSRKKVDQMAKVLELTTSVMYMDDLDRLLQRMCEAIVQSFGFRRASIRVIDIDRQTFLLRAMYGYPAWIEKGSERSMQEVLEDFDDDYRVGATSYYARYEQQKYGMDHFEFLAHPELADVPRKSTDAWHERDVLMAAFKDSTGRLSGYLQVDEPSDLRVPGLDQIELLEILAGIASIAIENVKMYRKQVMAANEIALLNDLMTHDINNFNQGIMGYLELLLQDKRLDDNQKRYAERALVQVRNNARLIDNIRKLAKVRVMSDDDFVPTDIRDAIAEAEVAVSKASSDRKISIVSMVPRGAHYTLANSYLTDVFTNVLSNAVKFDSSRKVRVEIQISEEMVGQIDCWIVSVIDRGRGIPDDRKNAVFERFATGVTGVKGFGLGLSIVSAAIDKFGGRIWVEDRIKGDYTKGTVFKIMLPKAEPPRAAKGGKAGPDQITSSGESAPERP